MVVVGWVVVMVVMVADIASTSQHPISMGTNQSRSYGACGAIQS